MSKSKKIINLLVVIWLMTMVTVFFFYKVGLVDITVKHVKDGNTLQAGGLVALMVALIVIFTWAATQLGKIEAFSNIFPKIE